MPGTEERHSHKSVGNEIVENMFEFLLYSDSRTIMIQQIIDLEYSIINSSQSITFWD